MKKLLLILILFSASVSADFFDKWTDDNLCGWVDTPATPDKITAEVKKRKINCVGGNAIVSSAKQEKKSAKQEKKSAKQEKKSAKQEKKSAKQEKKEK